MILGLSVGGRGGPNLPLPRLGKCFWGGRIHLIRRKPQSETYQHRHGGQQIPFPPQFALGFNVLSRAVIKVEYLRVGFVKLADAHL